MSMDARVVPGWVLVVLFGCGGDTPEIGDDTDTGGVDSSSGPVVGDTANGDSSSGAPGVDATGDTSADTSDSGGHETAATSDTAGEATDEGTTSGSGGETTSGETTDGETTDGETTDGETTDGETTDGETTDSGLLPGCDAELDPDAPITFAPDRIAVDVDDVFYLFDEPFNRIYRWSTECGSAYPVIELGPGAYEMAYSEAHHALYVGYALGDVNVIDLAAGTTEAPFTALVGTPLGLVAAGDYVLAVDTEGAWESHYTFDEMGNLIDAVEWNHPSPEYTWSAANERLYFFRQGTSPNDLHWEQVDQTTGMIVAEGESPYHGAYSIVPPIRVSDDGDYVLLGNGHVYDGLSLERPDAIPRQIVDATWVDGTFVTIAGDTNTTLERWDPTGYFERIDAALYPGAAVAVTMASDGPWVLSLASGALTFTPYEPGDDGDGDGVPFASDDFPLDPAASVDSDFDGAPDAWNPTFGPGDSNTGLDLDAHPMLAACTSGAICDLQDQPLTGAPIGGVADAMGDVYLLAADDQRLVRWSSALESFVDPIPLRPGAEHVTYDAVSDALFVSHDNGWVSEVQLQGSLTERHWRTLPEPAHGLAMAGQFVLAADATGAWNTHYTFDVAGEEISRVEWNRQSSAYAWNPVIDRIYFFRDGTSPNDLLFETVDQISGMIVDGGDSPYHGDYGIEGPIAVSPNGSFVMIGTGQVYDSVTLVHITFLPEGNLVDMLWADDHILTARSDGAGATLVERWSSDFVLETSETHAGEPYRLFATDNGEVIVTLVGSQPELTLQP